MAAYQAVRQYFLVRDQAGSKQPPVRKAAPRKMKQMSSKSIQATSFCQSDAKSTLLVPLTFIKGKKISKAKLSILFIFFLSFLHSSFTNKHNQNTIWCVRIIYMPNECFAPKHLPFLAWGGVQVTTGKVRPQNCLQNILHAQSMTSGVSVQPFRVWYVQSGHRSKQKFDYRFLYLLGHEGQFSATRDAVVHLDTFWISST